MTRQHTPHTDLTLESTYIRSCIRSGRPSHNVNADERLAPEDCSTDANRALLTALHSLADARRPIDGFTLREAVLEQPRATQAVESLDRILSGDEVSKSVESMAVKLRDMAKRRRRHEHLTQALAASLDCRDDAVIEHSLDAASDGTASKAKEFLQAGEVVYEALEFFKNAAVSRAMRTGFAVLDRAVGSLMPGTMTILGGTTGSGKSSLMLAMALHQARAGTPTAIVSTEDAATVWGPRIAAHYLGMNPDVFAPGMFSEHQAKALAACELASRDGLHMAFEIQRPLGDVLRAVRHCARKLRCKVIYVDYLQAIGWEQGKDDTRRLFISHAVSALKAACAELEVALVIGSQLKRADSGNDFKEPNLSALKESGDIENMAEVVALLWKTSDKEDAATNGKIAKVKWSAKRPRFEVLRHQESGAVVELRDGFSDPGPQDAGPGGWKR